MQKTWYAACFFRVMVDPIIRKWGKRQHVPTIHHLLQHYEFSASYIGALRTFSDLAKLWCTSAMQCLSTHQNSQKHMQNFTTHRPCLGLLCEPSRRLPPSSSFSRLSVLGFLSEPSRRLPPSSSFSRLSVVGFLSEP